MQEIEIVRGTTNIFNITITNTGSAYTPKPGDRVVFGVKKCNKPGDPSIIKTAPVLDNGTAQIKISPDDTMEMCCDNYSYDIGLESGEDFFVIVPESPFRIKNNITSRGIIND